jgi:hypothetical protein
MAVLLFHWLSLCKSGKCGCGLWHVLWWRKWCVLAPQSFAISDFCRTDHATPHYPQKLALTSPTSGSCSVGIVRSRTKATELGSPVWRVFVCPEVLLELCVPLGLMHTLPNEQGSCKHPLDLVYLALMDVKWDAIMLGAFCIVSMPLSLASVPWRWQLQCLLKQRTFNIGCRFLPKIDVTHISYICMTICVQEGPDSVL